MRFRCRKLKKKVERNSIYTYKRLTFAKLAHVLRDPVSFS